MTFVWNPVVIVNAMLCVIILLLGCGGFRRNRDAAALLIGIAFGIFGFSHIATLLGYGRSLTDFLIVIRVLAYLLVVLALYRAAVKR